MPIGISTLCTFGKTFKELSSYCDVAPPLIELVDDWRDSLNKDRISQIREIRSAHGIVFTVHTPFVGVNISSANEKLRALSVKIIKKSISNASEIGAQVAVVHPGSSSMLDDYYPGTHWKANIRSLKSILSFAEDLGVTAGLENMPARTSAFMQRIEEFERAEEEGLDFKIALDIGHANTHSLVKAFVERYEHKIVHVHLHDNMGQEDQHLVMGQGTADWGWLGSKLSFRTMTAAVESLSLRDALKCLEKANQVFSS